jgi:hypothetical protein
MITLLIESNQKLAIRQMEFEFENRKLELESCAYVQTIQLVKLPKCLEIFYMLLNDSNIYKCVILCKEEIH